jgi:bifunctional non-homologous end joining protein LigD
MSTDRSRMPQLPTPSDAVISSVEWLFEPAWRGERLIVEVTDGEVRIFDSAGEPADEEFAEAAAVLASVIDADHAVIDGMWTAMPFLGAGSAAQHLADAIAEEGLAEEVPDPIETEKRRAFVALDLVELDEQPLHDVPYLERRRVLASVVSETVQVRLSPAVRNPIHNWLGAWRAGGFTHYVAKHANSRYHPGEIAEDWLEIPTAAQRVPTTLGRLIGSRPKKVPRIHDERTARDADSAGEFDAGGDAAADEDRPAPEE